MALQEAFQAKEQEFAHVVKVGAHAVPGRRAHHPGPRDGRLRRGPQPRPLAHLQVRGAAARGQPGRHRHRHRLRGAAAVHLPRGRHAARAHRHRLRARREPDRGHAERRRLRRGPRHPQGLRQHRCSRSAATCACCRARARRPGWARSACRAGRPARQHHARQGQPRDPRGGQPGGHARSWATTPPSPPAAGLRQPRAQRRSCRSSPPACCESLQLLAARLRDPAPLLRRGHRGRRGALRGARATPPAAAATALVPEIGYDGACALVEPRPWPAAAASATSRRRQRPAHRRASSTSCSPRGGLPPRHAATPSRDASQRRRSAGSRRIGNGGRAYEHAGRAQGHAPAHRHVRPPQRGQVAAC